MSEVQHTYLYRRNPILVEKTPLQTGRDAKSMRDYAAHSTTSNAHMTRMSVEGRILLFVRGVRAVCGTGGWGIPNHVTLKE
jgi:hypothetical protein